MHCDIFGNNVSSHIVNYELTFIDAIFSQTIAYSRTYIILVLILCCLMFSAFICFFNLKFVSRVFFFVINLLLVCCLIIIVTILLL